jgi:hypothetical protein
MLLTRSLTIPRDNLLLDRKYHRLIMATLTFGRVPANKLSGVCMHPISAGDLRNGGSGEVVAR